MRPRVPKTEMAMAVPAEFSGEIPPLLLKKIQKMRSLVDQAMGMRNAVLAKQRVVDQLAIEIQKDLVDLAAAISAKSKRTDQ